VERCAECGFEYDLLAAEGAGAAIAEGVGRLAAIVGREASRPRERRSHDTWSPLEYGCHLRDVLLVQRERLLMARREECPSLQPMGRDERVDHDGYAEQEPGAVARQLADASLLLVNAAGRLSPDDWERTLIYNYPTPQERTLRWLVVHTGHEVHHHLLDVERQLQG
jgi:hypothetical protein